MDTKPGDAEKVEQGETGDQASSPSPPPGEGADVSAPTSTEDVVAASAAPTAEETATKKAEEGAVSDDKAVTEKEVPAPVLTEETPDPVRPSTPTPPSPVRPASPALQEEKSSVQWSAVPSLLQRQESQSSDEEDLLGDNNGTNAGAVEVQPVGSVRDLVSFHEKVSQETQSKQNWSPKNSISVTDPAGQIKTYEASSSATETGAPAGAAAGGEYSASLFDNTDGAKNEDSSSADKPVETEDDEEKVQVVLYPADEKDEIMPIMPETPKKTPTDKKDGTPATQVASSDSSHGGGETDLEMQDVQRDLFGGDGSSPKGKKTTTEEDAKKKKRTILFLLAILIAAGIAIVIAVLASKNDDSKDGPEKVNRGTPNEDEEPPVLVLPGVDPTPAPTQDLDIPLTPFPTMGDGGTEPSAPTAPTGTTTNAPTQSPVSTPGGPVYFARLEQAVAIAEELGIDLDNSEPETDAFNAGVNFVISENNTTETSRLEQRLILAGLQNAFLGSEANGRQLQATREFALQNVNECDWDGIVCECVEFSETDSCLEEAVVELQLGRLNYKGFIPAFISRLSNLRLIDLNTNGLESTIPESMFNLTRLERVYMYGNRLSGSLSERVGDLSQLVELRLDSNNLSGSIPESISQLGGTLRKLLPYKKTRTLLQVAHRFLVSITCTHRLLESLQQRTDGIIPRMEKNAPALFLGYRKEPAFWSIASQICNKCHKPPTPSHRQQCIHWATSRELLRSW